ncbi:MAG: chemotaxis response regulator protein-glutamate methylesterase [Synergistaceae bacterium]|jgi:two-component system chemotaxis response regulator CheB|nr:chemotaxis response regulator protein-glutamate methylesterase [Synergistaceae bacterium]
MKKPDKIKILVVDDSAFMRRVIADILSEDPRFEVVGRARNGAEAMEAVRTLSPDVVTLDMEMPGKNGIEVLEEIMDFKPVPVVMVSCLTKKNANETMRALDLGAVDFVTKPSGNISPDMRKVGDELRRKVAGASRAIFLGPRGAGKSPHAREPFPPPPRRGASKGKFEMLVIAASTGGPKALQEIIPNLSGDFPLPVMIVQHMPPGFTTSFAKRLDERSGLTVVEGRDGMPVRKGTVVIAPGGYHLMAERKGADILCKLAGTPPVRSVRPAADVLFTSVSETACGSVLALILTGMGKDGLDGAKTLKDKGAYIIAESRETSVIFGMPGAVVAAGLADEVLPLYAIAEGLERVAR